MTRRLLIRGVLLLILLSGGAIVNVAVAWGFALVFKVPLVIFGTSGRVGEGDVVWFVQVDQSLGSLLIRRNTHPRGIEQPAEPKEFEGLYASRSKRTKTSIAHIVPSWSRAHLPAPAGPWPQQSLDEYAFGWPARVFRCEGNEVKYRLDKHEQRKSTSATPPVHDDLVGGLRITSESGSLGRFNDTFIPLTPIWPGFAINTIFYAAVLWVMFVLPFALRRRLRIRRGLCPACAYPIGSSPVCTECGGPLKGLPT